jgi:hypothetical protein
VSATSRWHSAFSIGSNRKSANPYFRIVARSKRTILFELGHDIHDAVVAAPFLEFV